MRSHERRTRPPQAAETSIDRLNAAWPTATLVHLPIHASWLNQIEIYFSILQRKALTPNDFNDLAAIEARIRAIEGDYQTIAKPSRWGQCKPSRSRASGTWRW